MAGKTIDMSKLRKVIKLHVGGKSKVFISGYLGLSGENAILTTPKRSMLTSYFHLSKIAI